MRRRSIWQKMYWGFWNFLRKIGVWDSCPNCDSADMCGGLDSPDCHVCGHDKKHDCPPGWVWGWVVPNCIQRRIMDRRIREWEKQNLPEKERRF